MSLENSTSTLNRFIIEAISLKSCELKKQLLKDCRDSARPKQYAGLQLEMHRKKQPELALPRAVFARLIVAGTGYGDLTANHRCFSYTTAAIFASATEKIQRAISSSLG